MQVICLEEPAFYELLHQAVAHLKSSFGQEPVRWIGAEEAMKLLNINSKTTLQKYRDEGRIRFSQPDKRIILYDRHSIDEFLEAHAQNTF